MACIYLALCLIFFKLLLAEILEILLVVPIVVFVVVVAIADFVMYF
jgi:hypothetical protein